VEGQPNLEIQEAGAAQGVFSLLRRARLGPNPKYFFWTGNGNPRTAVADAQRSFRKLFKLADVTGHPHMFRDTFAVELLKHGVSIETVSMLPGHPSIKVKEKHYYKPWVKTLQDKLEADAMKGWPRPAPSHTSGRRKAAASRKSPRHRNG
jgi:integrase